VLLEGASTNLATYSGDTSNAVWEVIAGQTKTTGQPDPIGGNNACIYAASGTSAKRFRPFSNISYVAGNTYTGSYFVRNSSSGFIQLYFTNAGWGSSQYANFSLSGNGSVTATGGTVVAQIFKLSNGWYRVSLTATCTVSNAGATIECTMIDSGTASRHQVTTGDLSIAVWGCNFVEQDFLSSYINSGASASSRVADIFRAPVGAENVMLGRDTFGALVRCDGLGQLAGGSNQLASISIITTASVSLIRTGGPAYPQNVFANDTTSPTLAISMPSGNITTPFAVALTQNATGRAGSARGGTVVTQSTFASPATNVHIGYRASAIPDYRGYKTVAFGPTRLSDAQLVALSGVT
jgi:hypothetical protein